jgi:hypothetical protein
VPIGQAFDQRRGPKCREFGFEQRAPAVVLVAQADVDATDADHATTCAAISMHWLGKRKL